MASLVFFAGCSSSAASHCAALHCSDAVTMNSERMQQQNSKKELHSQIGFYLVQPVRSMNLSFCRKDFRTFFLYIPNFPQTFSAIQTLQTNTSLKNKDLIPTNATKKLYIGRYVKAFGPSSDQPTR
jgi:hypothetical protein